MARYVTTMVVFEQRHSKLSSAILREQNMFVHLNWEDSSNLRLINMQIDEYGKVTLIWAAAL